MEDPSDQLMRALDLLSEVADGITAEQAPEVLDDATLQTFWREWPRASAWAGALWRRLDSDLAEPAEVAGDPDLDELGESG